MLLHSAFDLPLHHDDAHRHFFPLSDVRFASPLSYWDPAHYGNPMALLELGLVCGASIWLWARFPSRPARAALLGVIGLYLGGHALFFFSS